MNVKTWREFATDLALYARTKLFETHRGAVLVRRTSDGNVVAAVFGNDNYAFDGRSRREVELIRQQIRKGSLAELGFGLSTDGYSWAILVEADQHTCQTVVGKAFQVEMARATLEEAVWDAWRRACGVPADGNGRAADSCQPAH
jgi:hypothetical protein